MDVKCRNKANKVLNEGGYSSMMQSCEAFTCGEYTMEDSSMHCTFTHSMCMPLHVACRDSDNYEGCIRQLKNPLLKLRSLSFT
jgi:rRNA maturation protein Nop10